VSLLGGDIPAVKTIQDIVAQYGEAQLDEQGIPFETIVFEEDEVSLDEIMSDLDSWLLKAEGKIKNKVGSPVIRTYLKEVKSKLKALVGKQQLAEDEAIDVRVNRIRDAYYDQTRQGLPQEIKSDYGYVVEVYGDYVIVDKGGNYYKLPYSETDDGIVFDTATMKEVKRVYEVVKQSEAGETSNSDKEIKQKEELMENELRELLGLAEDADVLEAIKALKEKSESKTELAESVSLAEHEEVKTKVTQLETKLAEDARDKAVGDAINGGRITPAQKEWADAYALSDPSGFETFAASQPVIVELGERGVEGNAEDIELTEQELKMAGSLGVSKEDLMATKKAEKEGR